MRHSSTHSWRPLLLMLCLMFAQCLPSIAAAQGFLPQPTGNSGRHEIGSCARHYGGANYQSYEFTSKVVACVEGTVREAVLQMMTILSVEFGWVMSILSTLIIIFFGIRVAMGERELLKRTSTLFIKLAFIAVFMNMLPTIVDWVFQIFRELMMLVTGGISPWQRIDIFLGKLFGFGSQITLLNGVLGLVSASLFSSGTGVSVFTSGVVALLNLLIFLLSLVYTYLLAFLIVGFLLMLMPIMIPLSLFFYTERMFTKWVDIIISAILTPVMLFAFIWMFLGIFDILIQNIFAILGGNDFRPYWRLNNSLCSWMMPSDPNANVLMQNTSRAEDVANVSRKVNSAIQGNINPLAKNSFNACPGRTATLDYGANDVYINQRLSYAFVNLWVFSSLMKSMLQLIPEVAASIARVATPYVTFGAGSQVIAKLKEGTGKLEGGAKSLASLPDKLQQTGKQISNFSEQISNLVGRRK